MLETVCAFVCSSLTNEKLDRSPLIDLKKEAFSISRIIQNIKIDKMNRLPNGVPQEIPKYSFISVSHGILLNNVVPNVANVVKNYWNSLSLIN